MRTANQCNGKKNTIITGIRCFKGKIPIKSKIGNNITKYIFFLSTGIFLKDTQCGLRAFHTNLIPFMLDVKGNRLEYEMNVLLKASKEIQIETIPIETIYINNNSSTHFKVVKDAYIIYKNIIKFSISSIISFLVDYSLYSILINILLFLNENIKIIIANIIARIISATINYMINKNHVFKDNQKHKQTAWKYFFLATGILIANTSIMMIIKKIVLENLYIIKLITEIFLFIISFLIQRLIIFKKKGENNEIS